MPDLELTGKQAAGKYADNSTKEGLILRPATWRELLLIIVGAVANDGGDGDGRQGQQAQETSAEGEREGAGAQA